MIVELYLLAAFLTARRPPYLFLGSPRAAGGIVDAGPAYQKNMSDEVAKLQRLYGGGDLTKFPDFKFPGQFVFFIL